MEWISVEDRLPEKEVNVLCVSMVLLNAAHPYGSAVFIAWVDCDDWYLADSGDAIPAHDLTHWMPLPAPPTEKQQQETMWIVKKVKEETCAK